MEMIEDDSAASIVSVIHMFEMADDLRYLEINSYFDLSMK